MWPIAGGSRHRGGLLHHARDTLVLQRWRDQRLAELGGGQGGSNPWACAGMARRGGQACNRGAGPEKPQESLSHFAAQICNATCRSPSLARGTDLARFVDAAQTLATFSTPLVPADTCCLGLGMPNGVAFDWHVVRTRGLERALGESSVFRARLASQVAVSSIRSAGGSVFRPHSPLVGLAGARLTCQGPRRGAAVF